jgi:hypothetical protein
MTFEQQIHELCQEAIACQSEEDAVSVAKRIQVLMHARIEELRSNISSLPLLGDTALAE